MLKYAILNIRKGGMTRMYIGIYIHVPFCVRKCPYCDFYSLGGVGETLKDAYTDALIARMRKKAGVTADTLYFGGGTPSLLGGKRLARLVETVRACFTLPADAEITMEANPADDLRDIFAAFAAAGGNRLSLGMQSSSPLILQQLGRRHTPQDVQKSVEDAQAAGIHNISLDMMLAVPQQTVEQVERDVAVCAALGVSHVSAYLLKIEAGTPFASQILDLPDDDEAVTLYLAAVEALEKAGYQQYEISNFAKPDKHSRHNLKYWNGESYLGFGPAAHSFFEGERYAYPRDLQGFIDGCAPILEQDSAIKAGSATEYAMLRLRLTEGLRADAFYARFGSSLPQTWIQAAKRLPCSLVRVDEQGIAFTKQGFLVSNALLTRILNL